MSDRSLPPATNYSTRWSLILRAQGSGREAQDALGELVRRYDAYILWLFRRAVRPPDVTAEDCKQEFLAGILRRADIAKLQQGVGSFRGWLNTSVRNFLKNEWKSWRAKRAGRAGTSHEAVDLAYDWTAEDELSLRQFATGTVQYVLAQLRDEARDKERFDRFVPFLPGPQLDLEPLEPYAAALGMSRTYLASRICVLRARFRELFEEATADTVPLEPDRRAGPPDEGKTG